MTDPTPRPVTRDQSFLAAILDRLDRQNELLTDVRDRLPQPVQVQVEPAVGAVELTEPAVPAAVPAAAAEVAEPEPPADPPAKPAAAKPAAKKTAAKRATSKTAGGGSPTRAKTTRPKGNS
jgi:outer membrane biosynthesis protein TonB